MQKPSCSACDGTDPNCVITDRDRTGTAESNFSADILYSASIFFAAGVDALKNGDIAHAAKQFQKAVDKDSGEWKSLYFLGWVQIIGEGKEQDRIKKSSDYVSMAIKEAGNKELLGAFAQEHLESFLEMNAELYKKKRSLNVIDYIIMPGQIDILRFFQFAAIVSGKLGWESGTAITKKIDHWIDTLTIRLLSQAEISGMHLRRHVEQMTKQDVLNENKLIDWLDKLCDVIMQVNHRCGERCFELQIAYRLNIVQQCMSKLDGACKVYHFSDSCQRDIAIEQAGVAQIYTFMILTMCKSVASYDISLKKQFVESVQLLKKLRVERHGSDAEIIYEVPFASYRNLYRQALEYIKQIREEDKEYMPPHSYWKDLEQLES